MPSFTPGKKRKAVTRDSPIQHVNVAGNGFLDGELEGIIPDDANEVSYDSGLEEGLFNGTTGASGTSDDDQDDQSAEATEDEEAFDSDEDIEKQVKGLQMNADLDGFDQIEDGLREDRMTELETNYRVTTDANGNARYEYQEIVPVYDSDDSDNRDATNTIGDIPLKYYDEYPHIGYDINGNKIMRPAKGEALDALLDSIDIPEGWTGLTDPATGKPLQLSKDELDTLKRVAQNEMTEDSYDPYPEMVEYFTGQTEVMPLSAAPEPKRRFIPSKNENKRIMKIVKAIREGRIKPYRAPEDSEVEDPTTNKYDIWADEQPRPKNAMHIPAPKLPPPGYEDSYHPPPEYLPDEDEKRQWEETDPEDRQRDYLPTDHSALRKVPGYDNVKTVFERCLDLYLAPRVRRNKFNIDPESLLPKLPSADELRPFPSTCATVFEGHNGRVRTVSVDPTGTLVATGGDDGHVRVWEGLTGRHLLSTRLSADEAVDVVRWRPNPETSILAAAVGNDLFFLVPLGLHTVNPDVERTSRTILDAGFGFVPSRSTTPGVEKPATWDRPLPKLVDNGVLLQVTLRAGIKAISWHRRGDYLSTVSPKAQSHAVAIHTLSKHLTQLPFRRLKGLPQTAQFHPLKPVFFVATQRTVRSYDLAQQVLVKILKPGARWISSLDVHPGGDNLIVGSYDRRLLWHDLDLSTRPYKTLRYHDKAIRSVKFHQGGYPLFADASDDGSLQIFHGKVVDDLLENATIVPLKVLKGHAVKGALGVLDIDWHPRHPWILSAGADGTGRLWC